MLKHDTDIALQGLVRSLSLVPESIDKLEPDVILVDVNSGILERGDLLNRLTAPVSGAAVIVMAMMGEVDTVRQAMLHGAQGFLLKPFSEEELLSSVRQAYDLLLQRRAEILDKPLLPPVADAELHPQAKVICVFSPKGGVGCTTIATNLAVALKKITDQRVTLVDGDLRFGDIDIALNVTSGASIAALLPNLDELDDQLLERALATHSSGIKVLIAPPNVDAADTIRPEQLRHLLRRLSSLGTGHIVVDAWSALNDCTLALMDVSTHIVIVATPQVTALRDTHRALEALQLLGYDLDQVLLVLNNCYHRSAFRLKEVERALGHPIAQVVEYSPNEVTASLNRGVPLFQEHEHSPAAQSILQLAQLISSRDRERPQLDTLKAKPTSATAPKKEKRGLFRWGLRRPAGEVRA